MRFTERSERKFRGPAGLTLAEVLVASTLLLLVCGLAIQAVRFALDYQREKQLERSLVEDALNSLRHVQRELEETNISSLYLNPEDNFLGLLSPRDNDGRLVTDPTTGSLLYFQAVSFSLEEGLLIKKVSPLAALQHTGENVLDLGLDQSHFQDLPATRVLTRDCLEFVIGYADRMGNPTEIGDGKAKLIVEEPEPGEPVLVDSVVRLGLKLRRKGRKVHAIQLETSVHPRN